MQLLSFEVGFHQKNPASSSSPPLTEPPSPYTPALSLKDQVNNRKCNTHRVTMGY